MMMMKMMMMMVMVMVMMMMMKSSVRAETSCKWLRKGSTHAETMFNQWSIRTMSILKTLGNSTAELNVSLSSFPERQYAHARRLTVEQKVIFLSEIFSDLSRISVAWSLNISDSAAPRMERFNSDLYRQRSELHHCVKLLNAPSSSSVTKLTKKIKVHLSALKRNLNQQDHVRSSLLAHLTSLDLLAASI